MALLFASCFLYLGLLFASLVPERELRAVLVCTFSLVVYSIAAVAAIWVGYSNLLIELIGLKAAVLTGYILADSSRRREFFSTAKELVSFLPLLIILWAYSIFVGPFIDHGVDLFRHMTDIQSALFHLRETGGHLLDETANIGTYNHLVHNLSALFAYVFELSGTEIIPRINFVYTVIWTFSIYFFCRFIFLNNVSTKQKATVMAYVATLLFWLTFGINSFSFPRYYFASPAILTYSGYLSMLALGLYMFSKGVVCGRLLGFFGVIAIVVFYLHPQELMLTVAMLSTICIGFLIKECLGPSYRVDLPSGHRLRWICLTVVIVSIAVSGLIIFTVERDLATTTRLLNIGKWIPFIHEVYILRPNFQFYTVLGWWGISVYVVTLLNIRYTLRNAFLLALLIFPLVTVFNPLYTEAFLRIQNSLTLWRVLYALHLPILCTSLLFYLLTNQAGSSKARVAARFLQVGLLIIMAGPLTGASLESSMSRWPSIVKTPVANSYLHWADLIGFLDSIDDRKDILVDPSTGYAISALTKHKTYTKKFYGTKHGIRINFEDYDISTFNKRKGWLLVLNQRDGAVNSKLEKPFHVPPDVMLVSNQYDSRLINFVTQNKGVLFKELWQADGISVYEVL